MSAPPHFDHPPVTDSDAMEIEEIHFEHETLPTIETLSLRNNVAHSVGQSSLPIPSKKIKRPLDDLTHDGSQTIVGFRTSSYAPAPGNEVTKRR
jgi:hypothetical protein